MKQFEIKKFETYTGKNKASVNLSNKTLEDYVSVDETKSFDEDEKDEKDCKPTKEKEKVEKDCKPTKEKDEKEKVEETLSFDEFLNEKQFAKKVVLAEAEKILSDAGYTRIEISEMSIDNIIKTAKECKETGKCKKKSNKIDESTKSFDEFLKKDCDDDDKDEDDDKESNTGWGGDTEPKEETTKESLKSFDEFFK